MTATLAPLRARNHSGGETALVTKLARRLGYTPATMSQKLWGNGRLNLQVVEVIRLCRQEGQEELLAKWLRPVIDAYEQRAVTPVTDRRLWAVAQEADAAEDVAELAYQMDPSDANLERLIQAKGREIIREHAVLDALAVEQKRRRAAAGARA